MPRSSHSASSFNSVHSSSSSSSSSSTTPTVAPLSPANVIRTRPTATMKHTHSAATIDSSATAVTSTTSAHDLRRSIDAKDSRATATSAGVAAAAAAAAAKSSSVKSTVSESSSSSNSVFAIHPTNGHPVNLQDLAPSPSDDPLALNNDTRQVNKANQDRVQRQEEIEDANAKGPICAWVDLPHWMQDNPAIFTGYRRQTFSYKKCIQSLFFLHNESVNIWSHLLGAIVFVVLAPLSYFYIVGVMDTIHWTDLAVLYAFMAGAIICLSFSASFHCFSCHSEPVAGQWNRCDYIGIVFLIVGSFYPAIFYGFYCTPKWQIMYISLISLIGAATAVAVIRPKFRTPQYRWVRSSLFLAMGLSGIFPVIHGIVLYGYQMAVEAVALKYMFCMGASYVIGALLYASRTPECWFPGKFDHFGASHQIFHICVLMGCAIHFVGVSKAMAFWHEGNHNCSIPLDQMMLNR